MTNQGSAHGRFTRALKQRKLRAAKVALREIGTPSLLDALDYLELLTETKVEKLPGAALRWHGRFELEATMLTIAESQLALSALGALCAGDREAIDVLRRLLRRVRPTITRRIS